MKILDHPQDVDTSESFNCPLHMSFAHFEGDIHCIGTLLDRIEREDLGLIVANLAIDEVQVIEELFVAGVLVCS